MTTSTAEIAADDQAGNWTTADVAAFIGRSVDTVRRMCRGNKIPHRHIGRDFTFVEGEVRRWWHEQKRGPETQSVIAWRARGRK